VTLFSAVLIMPLEPRRGPDAHRCTITEWVLKEDKRLLASFRVSEVINQSAFDLDTSAWWLRDNSIKISKAKLLQRSFLKSKISPFSFSLLVKDSTQDIERTIFDYLSWVSNECKHFFLSFFYPDLISAGTMT
jgi:hypothetical protein